MALQLYTIQFRVKTSGQQVTTGTNVMPGYDEGDAVRRLLRILAAALRAQGLNEIIVVEIQNVRLQSEPITTSAIPPEEAWKYN